MNARRGKRGSVTLLAPRSIVSRVPSKIACTRAKSSSVISETNDFEGKQRIQRAIFPYGLKYSPQEGFGTAVSYFFLVASGVEEGRFGSVVRPERFELPTYCSGGNRSIQLSYGRAALILHDVLFIVRSQMERLILLRFSLSLCFRPFSIATAACTTYISCGHKQRDGPVPKAMVDKARLATSHCVAPVRADPCRTRAP
jgi:hypothetical protein